MSTAALETRVELSRSRLETMLKVLDVDGAVRRVRGGWIATGEDWSYDAERYAKVPRCAGTSSRRCATTSAPTSCRMRFLREQLDDPVAERLRAVRQLRRSRACRRGRPKRRLRRSRRVLRRPGVPIEPRRQWPTAMAGLGVDGQRQAAAGRTGRAGTGGRAGSPTSGWGPRVRSLLAADAPDGPVPADLVQVAVRVLAAWDWEQRPVAVVRDRLAPARSADRRSGRPAGDDRPAGRPGRGRSTGRARLPAARTAPCGCARCGTATGCRSRSSTSWPATERSADPAGGRPARHRLDDDRGRPAAEGGRRGQVMPFTLGISG